MRLKSSVIAIPAPAVLLVSTIDRMPGVALLKVAVRFRILEPLLDVR